MKTNNQIQEEFSKVERKFLEARSKLRNLSDKSFRYKKALKEYNEALERLEEFKEKLNETVSFRESVYSVRCGNCGQKIGISCNEPPEIYKCNFCGKTTQIKYQIEKNASY